MLSNSPLLRTRAIVYRWLLALVLTSCAEGARGQVPATVAAELTAVFQARALALGASSDTSTLFRQVLDVRFEGTDLGTPAIPVFRAQNRGVLHGAMILVAISAGRAIQLGGAPSPGAVEVARAMNLRIGRSTEVDREVAWRLARLLDPFGAQSVVMEGDIDRISPFSAPRLGREPMPVGPGVCIRVMSLDHIGDAQAHLRYCFQGSLDGTVIAWERAESGE